MISHLAAWVGENNDGKTEIKAMKVTGTEPSPEVPGIGISNY